ncbi:MAG: DUF1800 family protein [Dongiaceae bacterium]
MTAEAAAFVALNRFGLGAAFGELQRAGDDPDRWLRAQLAPRPEPPPELAGFAAGSDHARTIVNAVQDKSILKEKFRKTARAVYLEEVGQRTLAAIRSRTPLIERLVHFWSNHFTVSIAGKPVLAMLVGAFEREAIRPHVTGRFADMLRAVVGHPAMLLYLDNATSVGPNSRGGRARDKGLNENLARELLELHTLGVDGGYTQADVQELAKILTGWSVGRPKSRDAGQFRFHDIIHEPGEKTLLGRRYREAGMAEGEAVLADLARHPSTARFIARKLARHFIADQPPPAAIDRLAEIFRDSDGDLLEVTHGLIARDEAWADPLAKVKTPQELVIAALRLTTYDGDAEKLVGALALLGQTPFAAPSPAGWPDDAAGWISPESSLRRIEWSMALAQRLPRDLSPSALAEATIAPVAARDTMLAIERASDVREAIALLFASPEFQRR